MTKKEAIYINDLVARFGIPGSEIHVGNTFKVNSDTARDMIRQAQAKASRRDPEKGEGDGAASGR